MSVVGPWLSVGCAEDGGTRVFFLFRMRAVFCVFVSHARSVSCFHFLCFWFDRPESE